MKNVIIIFKLLFLLMTLSLVSCIEKQDQLANKTLGRFTADSISISYPAINHVLTIGSPITIAPDSKVGKITACGIKYGTGSLPPGLSVDNECKIIGTPLVLAFTFNYKITAISEYNTTTEANITLTVGTFYNLGGVTSGLGAGQTVTVSNGVDTTIVTANGNFSLTPVSNGDAFSVTVVESNPARFTCSVVNGSGIVSQNTNNVQVNCAPSGTRTLGGTLSGLVPADGSIQLSNSGVNISVASNGGFTFGPLNYGVAFNITVTSKPLGYTCSVSANGTGTLNDDLNTVAVVCIPPTPKKIFAKVTGLNIGSFTIQNNGSEIVTVNSDGVFEFQNKVAFNTAYSVAVLTQPSEHTCAISNPSGTALADVTNISITCTANLYTVGGLVSGVTAGDHVKFVFNDDTSATEFDYDYDGMGASFTLPRSFEHGKQYRMYLSEVPAGKKCKFTTTNPTPSFKIIGDSVQGYINGSNISDVNISCVARDTANCEFGHYNYMSPLGTVKDMACDGTYLYVAGEFLDQGHQNGFMSDVPTSLFANYKQSYKVEGGGVRAAVSDENDGMYVAGEFTKVNGEVRNRIARLYKDGSLDQRFSPVVNGTISKIIVKGNYLYIGGGFTTVNSVARQNFAKLNRFTGELQSLTISFNGVIQDMAMRGNKLAIAGSFTTVSAPTAAVRACLAEIDTELDQLTSLVISFTSVCNILTLDKDSSGNLYAGGDFQNAGSVPSLNYLFRIKANNELDSVFATGTNSYVHKLRVIEESGADKLFLGGDFTTVFGSASTYLAKYNIDTLSKESLSNPFSSNIRKIAADDSYIYITDVAGKMARYAKGSSTANLTNVAHAASIQSSNLLENVNGKIYGSDKVSSYGSILSGSGLKYLFRYNLNTGRVDTNFDFNIGGVVNSIAVDGSTLIVGGVFTSINAIAQKYLAKIKLSDLTIDASFTPNLNSTVLKILLKNSELITSGNFTTVGGVAARKYLVSLDKTTGVHRSTIDTGLTSPSLSMVVHNNDLYFIAPGSTAVRKFSIANPLVEDMSFSIVGKNFNALTVGTSGVFVGSSSSGNAVEVSGVGTSKYVVKFNPSTGIRDALFLPVTTYLYGAMYLSNDESFLYTSISSSLIKLLSTTGVKQSAFIDPNVTSTGTAFVSNKIIEGSTYLIIGGNFNNNNPNYSVNLVMIPK